jgi:hypothetical protein
MLPEDRSSVLCAKLARFPRRLLRSSSPAFTAELARMIERVAKHAQFRWKLNVL